MTLTTRPTRSAAHHEPFLFRSLWRESASRMTHNRFNFLNRATVFRRVLAIPLDPTELFGRHDLTIYESSGKGNGRGKGGRGGQGDRIFSLSPSPCMQGEGGVRVLLHFWGTCDCPKGGMPKGTPIN